VPLARVLVFALALSHTAGLADIVFDDACEEECEDDGCADDCMPGQPCRCHCPSATPLLSGAAASTIALDTSHEVATGERVRAHADPDPREILHVPRRDA
jgi:hypothetical protein